MNMNAQISARIVIAMAANGGNLQQAFDSVLGEGAYVKLANEVWQAAQK